MSKAYTVVAHDPASGTMRLMPVLAAPGVGADGVRGRIAQRGLVPLFVLDGVHGSVDGRDAVPLERPRPVARSGWRDRLRLALAPVLATLVRAARAP